MSDFRQDAIDAIDNESRVTDNKRDLSGLYLAKSIIETLPSADEQDDNRLYIKIYADDEPSRKAEKLYQICGEAERHEVAQWLKEYFPSADGTTGKWVRLEREENVYDLHGVPTWGVNYMCDKCGFITTAIQDHFEQYKFCPHCGKRLVIER